MRRKTVAVDLDGVLHWYRRGWHDGTLYDEPTPGSRRAMAELSLRYDLVVFTCREDIEAVWAWLRKHKLDGFFKEVTNRKPLAEFYVDDRAVRFESWEQALAEMERHRHAHDAVGEQRRDQRSETEAVT